MSKDEGWGAYEVGAARLELPGESPVVVPQLCLRADSEGPAPAPVRIYLGTELAQHRAERMLLWSILTHRNPERSYEITLLRDVPGNPRKLGWATGFSNFRFLVPALAGGRGKVIYNDVDQLYLADPAELYDTPMGGCGYRAIGPRETSVMLLDCERMISVWRPQDIGRLSRRRLVDRATAQPGLFGAIDPRWNCRDEDHIDPDDAKVYHFTTLHTQPWRPFPERFVYHEHPEAQRWWDMRAAADAAGFQVFARDPAPRDERSERVAGASGGDFSAELRSLLTRSGADSIVCVGEEASSAALGVVEARALGVDELAGAADAPSAAALWVVGREGVCPDDVPRILHGLFECSRSLVYVRAGCRPGGAGVWLWPPRGSVGTERWWLDQIRAVAVRYPEHRWELDLVPPGRRSRRLRPGGGPLPGSQQPRVWALFDGTPHHERLARALADAVGWPHELREVAEPAAEAALRGILGGSLMNALLRPTGRGLEGVCMGPGSDSWPSLVISAGEVCRSRARFLREASGHRTRVVQLDTTLASPTSEFDLVVTPPAVGALSHPRRLQVEILAENAVLPRPAPGGLAGLKQAIGERAFVRPGNDRGTTRPQLGLEALFSRLLAEGLATVGTEPRVPSHAGMGGSASSARTDVLADVAARVRDLVTRAC